MDRFIPEAKPDQVLVELVCDRNPKDDCRANTGTIWAGKGDVQPFPRALWPKLAPHPDVWRLYTAAAENTSSPEGVKLTPEEGEAQAAFLRQVAEDKAAREADEARVRREQELLGQDTESVTATIVNPDAGPAAPSTEAGPAKEEAGEQVDLLGEDAEQPDAGGESNDLPLTPEELSTWTVVEIRDAAKRLEMGLHPRLNEEHLRAQFLEAANALVTQAREAQAKKED